ncbi:Xaa-Pro aminopeptidase [Paraglaciecola chathamensis]|uniref:Xaa-Pro aminopeptidase n=1 Tax=Paraglaciecola agarilytica NO2 TaxID=1125747 RepID=A0ABQ0I2I6_9ALTE|nr:Xaa-Pro aminopeptidase [Paraglaciecola agarilytica]GAC03493.1 Xaa-Pro aminopeptidase [Paraglaciecola agarilytica NO2]
MIAFDKNEFAQRRQRLLAQMQPNSICVVPSSALVTRSRDTEFPFRQGSYFEYLSGFPEPDACLVLTNSPEYPNGLSVLFCLDKDPNIEMWQGKRIGPREAKRTFGFDIVFDNEELDERLVELMNGHEQLYFALGHNQDCEERVLDCIEQLRSAPKQSQSAPSSIVDSRLLLDEMRLVKSPYEQNIMRQAGHISANAHMRAMAFAQAGRFEYQLEAELHHEFAMHGAKHPAYSTIVGSGENACILHYTENNAELKDGQLVLIDAGCELHGYAADITRTFPVSGQFSPQQRQLYQLVLDAQKAALACIKPGKTIGEATQAAIECITTGLLELGLLTGTLEENIAGQHYRTFFMHGLSHWLGLDVHDVGHYKAAGGDRPLMPGMVLTVEPGIYVAGDAPVAPCWRGIGIRIEDNVLITDSGHEILTGDVPKEISQIEALMAESFIQ